MLEFLKKKGNTSKPATIFAGTSEVNIKTSDPTNIINENVNSFVTLSRQKY